MLLAHQASARAGRAPQLLPCCSAALLPRCPSPRALGVPLLCIPSAPSCCADGLCWGLPLPRPLPPRRSSSTALTAPLTAASACRPSGRRVPGGHQAALLPVSRPALSLLASITMRRMVKGVPGRRLLVNQQVLQAGEQMGAAPLLGARRASPPTLPPPGTTCSPSCTAAPRKPPSPSSTAAPRAAPKRRRLRRGPAGLEPRCGGAGSAWQSSRRPGLLAVLLHRKMVVLRLRLPFSFVLFQLFVGQPFAVCMGSLACKAPYG